MENIWMFLQQTAAGGLCALFLLLLQRIFRNLLSPRWQYGIWGVLVLRLMIPVGAQGRSTVLDVWPWLEAARAGAELALDSAYSSPWTLSLPRGPLPILPAEPPRSLTDWLFLLYLAGALGLALWYLGAPCAYPSGSPGASRWRAPGGRPSTLWPNGTSCPAPCGWRSAAGSEVPS